MDFICDNKQPIELIILFIFLILEYWLGRTDKTKAGSFIEFIILLLTRRFKK